MHNLLQVYLKKKDMKREKDFALALWCEPHSQTGCSYSNPISLMVHFDSRNCGIKKEKYIRKKDMIREEDLRDKEHQVLLTMRGKSGAGGVV